MPPTQAHAFNPLDRIALAQSIERKLLEMPCVELPPPPFAGAGIYVIYYLGDFPAYKPIVTGACDLPIYVGEATPSGASTGGFLVSSPGRALSNRLRQHAATIDRAENLDLADFRCRYLLVEDIWIPLGEALAISHFEPVWNVVVQGFGKHASGAGRRAGRRSMWDTIHPGRAWALLEKPSDVTADEIFGRIAEFFAAKKPPEQKMEEIERGLTSIEEDAADAVET